MRIEIVDDAGGARDRIEAVLSAEAEAAGHPFRGEKMLLEARDGDAWLGGLAARVGAEWIYVELLATDPAARGRGVGRALMQRIEAVARERGMVGLWVDTFTFQAPDFYPRMGFTEVGRIEDYPLGGARIFFAKRLDGP